MIQLERNGSTYINELERLPKKNRIIVEQSLKTQIGIIICILFFVVLFGSRLFAAEYSRTYKFEKPKIITLTNGKQLLDLKGTRQRDYIIGAPILPVKPSKIFIPANEKVVSIDINYGSLITIEGSYLIQHGTKPHPLSFEGHVKVDKPAPSIYETNASYPPNNFGFTDSFGESITNGYSEGGAFAYIGNSRYGWYNPGSNVRGASNRAHKEFVETIFAEKITKIGEVHQISKTNLPLHSDLYRWIAFETTLLGCPATELFNRYSSDSDGGGGSNNFGCFIDSLRY